MTDKILYSLIESPTHPLFSEIYQELGFTEYRFTTMRKAISGLKKIKPDVVVAEFFYGFGNNYAGVNVSNLDVFLHSLQKYSSETKIIVFVSKQEHQFVEKLNSLFPLYKILVHPVHQETMIEALNFDSV